MTRILALIILIFSGLAANAASAADLMARCAKALNDAPSLQVNFSLSVGQNTSACSMTIARQRFTLKSPDMMVWYDGATQWTYITSDRELSITEPTAEELMECNPFAIVNHYANYYNVRAIQGKANTVELSPKHSGASIRRATITINPDNNLPAAINVTLANGHTFSVKVSSISRGGNIPQASFVYNKSSHPAATINDLR